MTDPELAASVRAALGLGDSDPDPPDLMAAAAALEAAAAATRADCGSVLLTAVTLIRTARGQGGTFEAARSALAASGWPLTTITDLGDLVAALTAMCAAHMTEEDIAHTARIAGDLP